MLFNTALQIIDLSIRFDRDRIQKDMVTEYY